MFKLKLKHSLLLVGFIFCVIFLVVKNIEAQKSQSEPSNAGLAPISNLVLNSTEKAEGETEIQGTIAPEFNSETTCPKLISEWRESSNSSLKPREWSETLTGIDSRLPFSVVRSGKYHEKSGEHIEYEAPVVALTLDACSGMKNGNYDEGLLQTLESLKIRATFFVTPSWIKHNQAVFQRIAENPLFEIASHGLTHRPASVNGKSVYNIQGTRSVEELCAEIIESRRQIYQYGLLQHNKKISWFRSGTAFYDEVAVNFIHFADYRIAGYSITLDQGATLNAHEVEKRTLQSKGGDILLAHFHRPQSGTGAGLVKALPQLLERGFVFVTLSEAFGKK
ncbi:polysaccharide deacetylase family protein [Desulfovibrio litoralis]|uniref:Peptidoglycan/xylan/chitin deacetylase, PgdA/CDA1 family n=1 Tax=Desulfovibrio litoralis DSM 11393 TaxID=1121455 RepID=A0A1M7SC28_9BACT|nr:polysaccharide deacetylase family protein [Desulfovibrio litoralis]SHN55964.1 Peptidoglycan/xylan/chitin deacetylase, PgdA/CDA1 family [Desulfovibrio litoralis DSM 11393]